MEGKL
jgi:catechol 2,3-dioxygenase-like lactoylglutathione lyase family enzyme